jgi:hypothetical protein
MFSSCIDQSLHEAGEESEPFKMQKGPLARPFHELDLFIKATMSKGPTLRKAVQTEGCPFPFITIPKPLLQIEISLDIGSPSFLYVDVKMKVGHKPRRGKARKIKPCIVV